MTRRQWLAERVSFITDPESHVEALKGRMISLLNEYEDTHFAEVSLEVRISLFNLKHGLYAFNLGSALISDRNGIFI